MPNKQVAKKPRTKASAKTGAQFKQSSKTVSAMQEQMRAMAVDLSAVKDSAAKANYFGFKDFKIDVVSPSKNKVALSDIKSNHPDLLRLKNGMGLRMSLPEIKTRLAWGGSISSSANTALTTVIPVDPSASAEFASFAGLFDEVKTLGGIMHFDFSSTGGTPTFVDIALGYDPANLGVYASVSEVLVASQNTGPLKLETAVATAVLNGPSVVNRTGYWKFPFECPKGPTAVATNSAAANQLVTGMWAATAQTPMYYGYIKPYIQGAGSSVVVTMFYYLVIDVAFRSRT